MPPTAATTTRRPASKEETADVLARADRAVSRSSDEDIQQLLPPEYFEDCLRRRSILRQIQGGDVRTLAIQSTVAQLRNDIEQGVFTVADAAE